MEAAKQCFPATKKGPAVLGKASWDAAADLCPSAQKKISKNRLVETYQQFQNSQDWGVWNGGIADSEGCLELGRINLDITDDDLQKQWDFAVDEEVSEQFWTQSDPKTDSIHHQVCQVGSGLCHKAIHFQQAQKFVDSTHRLLVSGYSV